MPYSCSHSRWVFTIHSPSWENYQTHWFWGHSPIKQGEWYWLLIEDCLCPVVYSSNTILCTCYPHRWATGFIELFDSTPNHYTTNVLTVKYTDVHSSTMLVYFFHEIANSLKHTRFLIKKNYWLVDQKWHPNSNSERTSNSTWGLSIIAEKVWQIAESTITRAVCPLQGGP